MENYREKLTRSILDKWYIEREKKWAGFMDEITRREYLEASELLPKVGTFKDRFHKVMILPKDERELTPYRNEAIEISISFKVAVFEKLHLRSGGFKWHCLNKIIN